MRAIFSAGCASAARGAARTARAPRKARRFIVGPRWYTGVRALLAPDARDAAPGSVPAWPRAVHRRTEARRPTRAGSRGPRAHRPPVLAAGPGAAEARR